MLEGYFYHKTDIQKLAAEKWEITEKRINQINFGIVDYNNRKLEGLIIESIVSSKNRIVGKYSEYCKRIHYIYDKDFEIWRKFKLSECSDETSSVLWKNSSNFKSLWIVN